MRKIENFRVLVTGGAGFIGSNLVETLLKQHNEVVCLDNFMTGKRSNLKAFRDDPGFSLIEGDIRDFNLCRRACAGIDYVLHQAALGSVPRSIEDPMTSAAVNISGFVNLLFAAQQAKVKRFVYAASSAVYGDSPKLPKIEPELGRPLSPYGITKYADELYADNFTRLYGIETVGLRYFNVFGKYQDTNGAYAAVIPKFALSLLKHESPTINGDGSFSRDFTYIDNVVEANQLAALATASEAVNTVYNIACGEQTTLNELFAELRKNLVKFDPGIAVVEPIHGPVRAGDIPHSLACIDKARRLLGYAPRYGLGEGLKKTAEWYFNHLNPELTTNGGNL
ncbi:MAG: SDR family oxidoreductase [Victivallaceae bacterium]|nr:SDR family oxidoreductase [Victivallaceae bacterium]